jgi:REP element-mobilizing transposase RayT
MTYSQRDDYEENEFPLAFLITFRTYGTWLHGDEKGSVGRNGNNIYGTPLMPRNESLKTKMSGLARQSPFVLTPPMRLVVEEAIKNLCKRRGHIMYAVNARTNHVHSVVGAQTAPEKVAPDLKASATKMLREKGLIAADQIVWARGQSRRYLWKHRHLDAAIDYTLYSQGLLPFEFER